MRSDDDRTTVHQALATFSVVPLLMFFLGPISELASGEQPLQNMWFVAFLGISALVLLGLAMVFSVFKLWGRVRKP